MSDVQHLAVRFFILFLGILRIFGEKMENDVYQEIVEEEIEDLSSYNTFKISSFSWNNCGNMPSRLTSLKISPDTITLPGSVTLTASAVNSVNAHTPLKMSLTIKRKVAFLWIKIPCILGVGSCTYNDVCTKLKKQFPSTKKCPSILSKNNIPCRCPFNQAKYYIPASVVKVKSSPRIPSWLSNGKYSVQVNMWNDGQQVVCEQFSFTVQS